MAHLDAVPEGLRKKVALEIAEFLDRQATTPLPPGAPAPLEIGETLTVWKLQSRAFETLESGLEGDVSDWLEQLPFVYHQILLRGKATGFARSYVQPTTDENVVVQVSSSLLAERLHELFEKIDRDEQEPFLAFDPVVRLLEIPPFQVSALWLFSEDRHESRIVIVHAPKRFMEVTADPFLNSAQFFQALRNSRSLRGVI